MTAVAVAWPADGAATWTTFRAAVRATGLVPDGATVVVTAAWPFAEAGTNLVLVTTA